MNIKCKFCGNINDITVKAHNYHKTKNIGKFYQCSACKVMMQPKVIKDLYTNQESSNYNLNKNFFYYLKQIILLNFIFNLKKFFYKKKDILDYGCGSGELAIALSFFYKKKKYLHCRCF